MQSKESIHETLQNFITKISNILFIIFSFISLIIIFFSLFKIYKNFYFHSNLLYLTSLSLAACLFVYFSLYKKLSLVIKVNTILLILFTMIPVYAFEIYLEITLSRSYAANKLGIDYDNRSSYEFYVDKREQGFEIYPNFRARDLFQEYYNKNNDKILPLSGISNAKVFLTNENGYFPIIETDKYGFANKGDDLYRKNKVNIALLGDSFTEGYSVLQDHSYVSLLRKKNKEAISFGKSGSGPLVELAHLIEYVKLLEPEIVLWIYYDNDLDDLDKELKVDLLKKYLYNENFSQNLIYRQKEVNTRILDYYSQNELFTKSNFKKYFASLESEIKILKLVNLRNRIGLVPNSNEFLGYDKSYEKNLVVFEDIMQKAQGVVSGWGGKFYFVYLPSNSSVMSKNEYHTKKKIFKIINKLNIEIIDLYELIFKDAQDPSAFFPLNKIAHFNANTNKLIVEKILNTID